MGRGKEGGGGGEGWDLWRRLEKCGNTQIERKI